MSGTVWALTSCLKRETLLFPLLKVIFGLHFSGSGEDSLDGLLKRMCPLTPSLSPRKRSTSQSKTEPPLLRTNKRTIYTAGRPPWYNVTGTSFKEAFVIGMFTSTLQPATHGLMLFSHFTNTSKIWPTPYVISFGNFSISARGLLSLIHLLVE